ncbi:cysteine-rich CWC family protein [Isoalcanivorax beigongshangi]|uniref:Cysteine-rich CWC family protein n=1 Tax=Isoalcanivorax beigongshangi TaxID=3238810 RepID=A0ABV4AEB2_9GAMM
MYGFGSAAGAHCGRKANRLCCAPCYLPDLIVTVPRSAVPSPIQQCPVCGADNQCAPAACGRFEVDCWCRHQPVSASVRATLPAAQRGTACLCPACAKVP